MYRLITIAFFILYSGGIFAQFRLGISGVHNKTNQEFLKANRGFGISGDFIVKQNFLLGLHLDKGFDESNNKTGNFFHCLEPTFGWGMGCPPGSDTNVISNYYVTSEIRNATLSFSYRFYHKKVSFSAGFGLSSLNAKTRKIVEDELISNIDDIHKALMFAPIIRVSYHFLEENFLEIFGQIRTGKLINQTWNQCEDADCVHAFKGDRNTQINFGIAINISKPKN